MYDIMELLHTLTINKTVQLNVLKLTKSFVE